MILFVIQIILQSLSTAISAWHLYRSRSLFWYFIGSASLLMVGRRITALLVFENHWLEPLDRLYLPITISALILFATVSAVFFDRERARLWRIEENNFQYSSIGKAYVGIDGSILMVNDALCDIWGMRREQVLAPGFRWQDITPEPDLSLDLGELKKLTDGEINSYTIDKRYRQPDGRYVWARLTVWRVEDFEGNLQHYSIIVFSLGFARALTQAIEALEREIEGLDAE